MLRSLLAKLLVDGCVFCGHAATAGRTCALCLQVLPLNECFCGRCGQPVATPLPADVPCADCQKSPPAFARARAPFCYAFPIDAALKKLKFSGQLVYAPAFAALLLPSIAANFAGCDSLVPVPLHRWRHNARGFNQADEICRLLAARTGLPLIRSVTRTRATRPQTGLSAAARSRNLKNAFRAPTGQCGRHPLIIDDVITTGATCNQMATALLRAGAREVSALAVAHAASG